MAVLREMFPVFPALAVGMATYMAAVVAHGIGKFISKTVYSAY